MSGVGWIGLGRVGLPMALVLDDVGHDVIGYDINPNSARYLDGVYDPCREEGLAELLATHAITMADSIEQVVANSHIVFVAVQTPHAPGYDGSTPAPAERRDFEYGFLVNAVREICQGAKRTGQATTVVIVSTVLPGTFNTHLRALANDHATLVYSPCFIAMGTTIADFRHPEFVLVGADSDTQSQAAAIELLEVLAKVHSRPARLVSIESAELTKVAYNVYLSAKIGFANYIGEICHKTGADADEVTDSLALATDRILSPRYMSAGMGDGGACHPRDLIALSSLSQHLSLSHDLPASLTSAREAHSRWLASEAVHWADLTGLPIVVLGRAYKPGSDLTFGSPATLLRHHIREARGGPPFDVPSWDPHTDARELPAYKAVFFVATKHPEFATMEFVVGSVVIDPFGYMPERPGVTTIHLGRKR